MKCENSTLTLLQRFVGLVLLELSELSSCAFSLSGNYFPRAVLVMMDYVRFGETKYNYFNRSLRHGTEMMHRNLHSDSVLVHTGYIGTGALMVPGCCTQPYSKHLQRFPEPSKWSLSLVH